MNKKNQHISLLHMAHHGLMPISTWYGIRYHPGENKVMTGEDESVMEAELWLVEELRMCSLVGSGDVWYGEVTYI